MNARALCFALLLSAASASCLRAQMTQQQIRDMSAKYPPLPPPSNLQVLPKDTPIPVLVTTMVRMSEGLAVQCDHCHAPAKPGSPELNFPSDANPNKAKARVMLRMVTEINGKYMAEIGQATPATTENGALTGPVVCGTCHQGHAVPPAYAPPKGYVLE